MLLAPPDGATVPVPEVTLDVRVQDADQDALEVRFYGRMLPGFSANPFRIVALPDTQGYSAYNPQTFNAQTQWVVDNRATLNIAHVAHPGDIVNAFRKNSPRFIHTPR